MNLFLLLVSRYWTRRENFIQFMRPTWQLWIAFLKKSSNNRFWREGFLINASLILPKKTLQKHNQTNKSFSFSFYKTKVTKQNITKNKHTIDWKKGKTSWTEMHWIFHVNVFCIYDQNSQKHFCQQPISDGLGSWQVH